MKNIEMAATQPGKAEQGLQGDVTPQQNLRAKRESLGRRFEGGASFLGQENHGFEGLEKRESKLQTRKSRGWGVKYQVRESRKWGG